AEANAEVRVGIGLHLDRDEGEVLDQERNLENLSGADARRGRDRIGTIAGGIGAVDCEFILTVRFPELKRESYVDVLAGAYGEGDSAGDHAGTIHRAPSRTRRVGRAASHAESSTG